MFWLKHILKSTLLLIIFFATWSYADTKNNASQPTAEKNQDPSFLEEHIIDKSVNEKHKKARSTIAEVEAFREGQILWEQEIDKKYKELKLKIENLRVDEIHSPLNQDPQKVKELKAAVIHALEESQNQWKIYQAAQNKFIDAYYGLFSGTMYYPICAEDLMQIQRERALELNSRLLMLSEHFEIRTSAEKDLLEK